MGKTPPIKNTLDAHPVGGGDAPDAGAGNERSQPRPADAPLLFQFGSDCEPLFIAADNRAAAARGRREGARRIQLPEAARGPSLASRGARANSP